eukprot:CAMPEP_0198343794 /NCGR_PEP_ID=MMETSP1450-20131203/62718_1 /TAXON_ID=753684 ORGANISM="Madagascaria erythrocladiodes, Strain CCMP3234" /NCGR_SAMPLE_ID=MMETSP1450 /ASSEMBLY_ACC=CAM_ASM_001115 /LENGTH=40 /DNA_ID= /DNA_START= /DNA_END= /DNA_ORIENTATION=
MGTDHLREAAWLNDTMRAPSEAHVFAVLDAALYAGVNVFD